MSTEHKLLERIRQRPTDFTVRELKSLMKQCGCIFSEGGRGSGLRFYHPDTGRILAFDQPHPEKALYRDQVKKVLQYLKEIGIL